MFFRGSLCRLLFPSWLYTQMPPLKVGKPTVAVSQQQAAFWGDLSHQRAGVTSHSEGSHPLPPSDQRQGSDVPLGQQLRRCIPSEPGGHSLIDHVRLGMGHPSVVPAARDHPVGEALPRPSECSSWQPVEKESDHWDRMVPASRHSTPDVLHLVHSAIGSVCNLSQSQAARICVSSSRSQSSSSGCSVHSIGQAMGLRLSANCSDATSASQVCALGSLSNASCGSTSALPAVASNPSRPLVDFPWEIPPFPRLLRQPQSGVFHNHPEQVHLFAWSLSNIPCETSSFLRQLPGVSAGQLQHLPPASMTASGQCMRVVAVRNKLVLSKPLFNN